MKPEKVIEMFQKDKNDDYLEFELIEEKDRRHSRPDLCAMLYLHERFLGKWKAIVWASHDEVGLSWSYKKLTEFDVVYLLRCGVSYDSETDSLVIYV